MKRSLTILFCVLLLAGCAKQKGLTVPDDSVTKPRGTTTTIPTPDGTGTGDTDGDGDNETELVIEGGTKEAKRARLSEFFFQSPANNPVNIRFGMNISPDGAGYGGDVWIRFEDGGQTREAMLSTRHPHYSGVTDTTPNVWFDWGGKTVFHGFFQDMYGALVIVIDESLDLGDGQPSTLVGGRVYFQNFGNVIPPQGPLKMCWQIQIGPYDCRTFIVGDTVDTRSALNPNNYGTESIPARQPYKLLGRFSALLRSAAFND